jgi:hypothetical protein
MSDPFDHAALGDLVLPDFQLDCRDWFVLTPEETNLADDATAPVLAVLTTAIIGSEDLRTANGVLTVGLLGENLPRTRLLRAACAAGEIVDDSAAAGEGVSYLIPTPDRRLAVVAEFSLEDSVDRQLRERVEALMVSFRWAD